MRSIERELKDAVDFAELADDEGDEASLEEARGALRGLKERAARAELEALLSGEADGNDAYLEIKAGAGGTESCDWAGMLMRMYSRWARAHGYEVTVEAEESGEQAGIKSATFRVEGEGETVYAGLRHAFQAVEADAARCFAIDGVGMGGLRVAAVCRFF